MNAVIVDCRLKTDDFQEPSVMSPKFHFVEIGGKNITVKQFLSGHHHASGN